MADFWFVAHQSIYLNPPKAIGDAGVAAVIIDESFWQAGLEGCDEKVAVPLDALEPGAVPVSEEDESFLSGMGVEAHASMRNS